MRSKMKNPVEMRVCHCGRCKIECNKHGQRAQCEECKSIRILGTEVKNGIVRHICGKCCDRLIEEERIKQEKEEKRISKAFKIMREKRNILKKSCIRTEEDERCLLPKVEEKKSEVEVKLEKVKRPKGKLKESS